MVKVSDIQDRDSLKAWLLDRPGDEIKTFAITIAHRAAMRVLPIYRHWVETSETARKPDLTALLFLRCNLISGVARKIPTPEIRKAAFAAAAATPIATTTAAADAAAATAAADDDANFAAAAATAAFTSSATLATDAAVAFTFPATLATAAAAAFATLAASAAAGAAGADDAFWREIRSDCGLLENGDMLLTTPLWNSAGNPFQKKWDAVRTSLSPDWSFWINWYQDALEGQEPDWDMLEEIALIPDGDWKKGPEHINNQVIAGIVGKYPKKRGEFPASEPMPPSEVEKKTIAQKVTANREVLALSIAGVLEQIEEYRERVRQSNSMDPEYKEGLLDFLGRLSKRLSDLMGELPDEGEVVSEEKSEKLALWWREYKDLIGVKAKDYVTPDNLAEATVPAGIILGCTGIGAIFGPMGAMAGGVVGRLITGQIKPGKAAGELMKDFDAPDSGA